MNDRPEDTNEQPDRELVDSLVAEFEQSWRDGETPEPKIQDFLARVDVPTRPVLLQRLLDVERGLRAEQHGDLQAKIDRLAERLRSDDDD